MACKPIHSRLFGPILTAAFYRDLLLIFDAKDRVIGACVGPPDVVGWPAVHQAAFEKLNAEGERAHFTKGERVHRRGRFPAINVGISMGTGPSHPGNLQLGNHAKMVARLLADRNIIRMANHASGMLHLITTEGTTPKN